MMRIRVASLLLVAFVIALGSAAAIASAVQPGDRQSTTRQRVSAPHATPPLANASCSVKPGNAQKVQPVDPPPGVRFATITVTIDPKGAPLAAYQFEITADHAFTVVGLDNAGHPSFSDPPRYDRAAAADGTDRLIIADYATLAAGQLVAKPQRVAVIHAAFTLDDAGQLADGISLTLTAAADPAGNRIDADMTYDLHLAERPGQE